MEAVELRPGRGSHNRGNMLGGFFWHIYYQDTRAGSIFINYNKETGQASIQIFLNRKSQSRGIGPLALIQACRSCGYPEVVATTRKGNKAARKAALKANFREIADGSRQIKLVWNKES